MEELFKHGVKGFEKVVDLVDAGITLVTATASKPRPPQNSAPESSGSPGSAGHHGPDQSGSKSDPRRQGFTASQIFNAKRIGMIGVTSTASSACTAAPLVTGALTVLVLVLRLGVA